MKNFQYTIDGHTLHIKPDERKGTIANILVDGQHPEVSPEEMPAYAAAISLALLAYDVEIVHDDEPGVITLAGGASDWGQPVQLMTQNMG